MAVFLKKIFIDNFKSYNEPQWIDVSTLNVFMGANSSGKSTALQTLLTIKQTIECNSPNIDLLLSGKFVTLGDFQEVINDSQKGYIKIGVALEYQSELGDGIDTTCFIWTFKERDNITVLSDLEVVINEENICLSKRDDQKYAINFNERSTEFLIDLKNLMLGSLYVQYDEIFNNIFQQFLNELLMGVLRTKKVEQVNKSEMVAISGTEKFYLLLMMIKINRLVMAMNMGGDDFVEKPFDLNVLTAKIQALLRRAYSCTGQLNVLEYRDVILNLNDAAVTFHGERMELTKNDFKILQILMENAGKIVKRDRIMERLWESDEFIDDNTLTVNMTRLRKKLESIGICDFIATKKGIGYVIE